VDLLADNRRLKTIVLRHKKGHKKAESLPLSFPLSFSTPYKVENYP